MRTLGVMLGVYLTAGIALATGQLVADHMTVEDSRTGERRPFYPLGSWSSGATPSEIARLGMNTAFVSAPSNEDRLSKSREFMRECDSLGIHVIQYLAFGGRQASAGWAPETVRLVGELASEPNLLAWNVGDDIYMPGLPAIRRTVDILRSISPTIPTVADCAPKIGRSEEGQRTFDNYVDIEMNYDYPLPDAEYPLSGNVFRDHQAFFDEQRAIYGGPLWTWTQTYTWHWTGQALNVSPEGPGPYPEPAQVRLLLHSELNRGLRGLLCFSHRELMLQPELSAEVALSFREFGVFNDALAAGEWLDRLPTSHETLDASGYHHKDAVVLSLALLGDEYHRWVDEAIMARVQIDVPWPSDDLPTAYLVRTPDLIRCEVERMTDNAIRVTVPELEVAGFVLVTSDSAEVQRVRRRVAEIPTELRGLVVPGVFARIQGVNTVVWQSGAFKLRDPSLAQASVDAGNRCAVAMSDGQNAEGVREWRTALRLCRVALDSVMNSAHAREDQLLPTERQHLRTPYGLHNIRALAQAPSINDSWRFVRTWRIAGPFPLNREVTGADGVPEGFSHAYPPELSDAPYSEYQTVDGSARWKSATADISGRLDFLPHFDTTRDVVAYARCRVITPADMTAEMSLGSNDGAVVFVNGIDVYSAPAPSGRKSTSHQDKFTVRLKHGPNTILVKVANFGANWRLYLAVDDPDRQLSIEEW
jgi:hypothetical protein